VYHTLYPPTVHEEAGLSSRTWLLGDVHAGTSRTVPEVPGTWIVATMNPYRLKKPLDGCLSYCTRPSLFSDRTPATGILSRSAARVNGV
jgi:hypothetical protein